MRISGKNLQNAKSYLTADTYQIKHESEKRTFMFAWVVKSVVIQKVTLVMEVILVVVCVVCTRLCLGVFGQHHPSQWGPKWPPGSYLHACTRTCMHHDLVLFRYRRKCNSCMGSGEGLCAVMVITCKIAIWCLVPTDSIGPQTRASAWVSE